MWRNIAFLWMGIFPIGLFAQNYYGKVVDREDRTSLEMAMVVALDSTEAILAYTWTDGEGRFRLANIPKAHSIRVSRMSYESMSQPAIQDTHYFSLSRKNLKLKEVQVKAPRISFQGDTISYLVSSFAESNDRSIAEVLKKMPGIEVSPSGLIKYNGEPINKFYIEGLDALGQRYGLATQNIKPEDVATVEVMENHQPVKALRHAVISDKAAINIKLKPEAKSRWLGHLDFRAGVPWLAYLGAFAMKIDKKGQTMVNHISDHTGMDPLLNLQAVGASFVIQEEQSKPQMPDYFRLDISPPPLNAKRTRWNQSHATHINHLQKLSGDYQLKVAALYGYEKRKAAQQQETHWFLPQETRIEILEDQVQTQEQQAHIELDLHANTEKYYLQNQFEADYGLERVRFQQGGTYPSLQKLQKPRYEFSNRFQYVRQVSGRVLTANALIDYASQSNRLQIQRDSMDALQVLNSAPLYLNLSAAYGLKTGPIQWMFKGGVRGQFDRLETQNEGVPILKDTLAWLRKDYLAFWLEPSMVYTEGRFRLSLYLPIEGQYHLKPSSSTPFIWKPLLMFRWSQDAFWTFYLNLTYGRAPVTDEALLSSPILQNARYIYSGALQLDQEMQGRVMASVNYKNPLISFWGRLSTQYLATEKDQLMSDYFVDEWIWMGYESQRHRSRTLLSLIDLSQGIDAIKARVSLEVQHQFRWQVQKRQAQVLSYASQTWLIKPSFNLKPLDWLQVTYDLHYQHTQWENDLETTLENHLLRQSLLVDIFIGKRWIIQVNADHVSQSITGDQNHQMVLADIQVEWQCNKRLSLRASVQNILNHDVYAYEIVSGLTRSRYAYQIRGREYLLSAYWRF